MSKKVVPMIHVPDVRATVDWYESIGFNVVESTATKPRTVRVLPSSLAAALANNKGDNIVQILKDAGQRRRRRLILKRCSLTRAGTRVNRVLKSR